MSINLISKNYQLDESIFEVVCDICGETEEIEGQWDDCLDFKKDEGWSSRKDNHNEWMDVCEECKNKS